jgi:preprotein translocase subunit SecF
VDRGIGPDPISGDDGQLLPSSNAANREHSGTRWSLRKGSRASMIEFFKEPNIDWMGKAKYFYALSAILLLAGWVSIFAKGGMYYGIDFKGGTNVDVRFTQPANIDQIRKALTAQGLGNNEIQSISDIGAGNSNEVQIFVGQKDLSDEARVIPAKPRW